MKSILMLLLFIPVSVISAASLQGVPGADYRSDQFIISVQHDVTLPVFDIRKNNFSGTGYASLDRIVARENILAVEKFYPWKIRRDLLRDVVGRLYVVTVGKTGNLASAIDAFAGDSGIEFAEQYNIHHYDYVPNDPMIGAWYHLRNIEAYLAWDYIRGDSTSRPILAIDDSGVYYDHPDLEPNMWINPGEDIDGDGRFTEADINGIDDDGNDFVDDVVGYDIAMNDCIPFEPTPTHGTHVAGCASMACDNGYGGASVSWKARLMAVKVAIDSDPGHIYYGFAGITYAADNGADFVNCSWGGYYSSQAEQNIINAIYAESVLVVAAAGNEAVSTRSYPAGYNHVVAVASVDPTDHLSSFSNYGTWITVSAPGEGVYSTWDHNAFTALDGTSMASPIAAGTLCLIKAANPTFTVDQLVQRLRSTADTIDYLNPTRRGQMGSGRVNAAAAIGRDMFPRINLVSSTITLTEDDGDGRINPGERFSVVANLQNIWAVARNVTGILRSDGQFTVIDSVADFGDIPGNNGTGNNSSNPFDVRVNADVEIRSHEFTLHITTASGIQTDLTLSANVTLEQVGFPGNIPANIDAPALVVNFDEDNNKEILISSSDGHYYSFEPDGSLTPNWPTLTSSEAPGGASVGDLDHDGNLDVIGMSRDGNVYAWHGAEGTPLTGFPHNCGTLMFSTPVLGDINGDSWLEIAVTVFTNRSVYVLNHDGTNFGSWPFVGRGTVMGSVAMADIDGDSLSEVIYGDLDSTVHVLNADKSEVAGFPIRLNGQIRTTPCAADIDGDGHLNIIVATSAGGVYALDYNGTILAGWPATAGAAITSSPSLSDIDNDGRLEIIVGCNNSRLNVFKDNGQLENGFPVTVGGMISASPVEGDVDGDGFPDIVFGAYDGKIYALNHLGQALRNFPIPAIASGQITGSAALSDLDGDGHCEIITGVKAPGNNLEVIDYRTDLPQEIFPWPAFGKDIARTSFYGPFVTDIDDRPGLPSSFALEQNYPNPFNSSTVIRFSIPSNQSANLAIYDLLGRRIRLLHNGFLDAGSHELLWDGVDQAGRPVSSGIYFYKLETSTTTSTKRMTLIK